MRGPIAFLLLLAAIELVHGFRVAKKAADEASFSSADRRRRRRRRRDGDSPSPPSPEPTSAPSPPAPTPPPGECHDFLFLGDFGFGNDKQKAVAKGMASVAAERRPSAIMALGDNLYGGTSHSRLVSRWREIYVDRYESLRKPWFSMTGNHDWNNGDARQEVTFTQSSSNKGGYWQTPALWYKLPFTTTSGATIDFFVFDGYLWQGNSKATRYASRSDQERWLEAALSNSTADWKVAMSHWPVYRWKGDSGVKESSYGSGLHKLLLKHKVALAFSGHYHHNELVQHRSGTYNVLGGGGGQSSSSSKKSPGNGLKAYYSGGGFWGARFCDSNRVELTLYGVNGEQKFRTTADNFAAGLAVSEADDDEEPDAQVVCNGVKLSSVDRVCGADTCTVAVDAPWQDTCGSYCAAHGLSCRGGWRQDDEEDCTPIEDLGCDRAVESNDNHMCQCA